MLFSSITFCAATLSCQKSGSTIFASLAAISSFNASKSSESPNLSISADMSANRRRASDISIISSLQDFTNECQAYLRQNLTSANTSKARNPTITTVRFRARPTKTLFINLDCKILFQ